MVFVHPSRMALVPQDSRSTRPHSDRGRGRSYDRDRRDEDRHRRTGGERETSRDRRRGNSDSGEEASTRRDRRSPIPSPAHRPTSGRESPKYDDYTRRGSAPPLDRNSEDTRPRTPSGGECRPETATENGHPWRQQENMYRRHGGYDGGGDYFERYAAPLLLLIGEKFSLPFIQAQATTY